MSEQSHTSDNPATQTVVLVKIDDAVGHLRKGTRITTTIPAAISRADAIDRAFAGLKLPHGHEDPECWQVVVEEAS